jgi:hypothetical protein
MLATARALCARHRVGPVLEPLPDHRDAAILDQDGVGVENRRWMSPLTSIPMLRITVFMACPRVSSPGRARLELCG